MKIYFNQIDLSSTPKQIDADAPFIDFEGTIKQAEELGDKLVDAGIVDSFIIPDYFSCREITFN